MLHRFKEKQSKETETFSVNNPLPSNRSKKTPRRMDDPTAGFADLLRPSAVPEFSPSGESYENDLSQAQMAFKMLKGAKKSPSPKKHYMSTTICAASKAFVPKKKVLAERNAAPDGELIHFPKLFNISPKTSAKSCQIDTQSCSSANCSTICPTDIESCFSEIDDNGEQNDPSSKPYDPITNYLTPRPTFLRYNPNRRHQIFRHRENESGERKCGLDVLQGLSFDAKKPTIEELENDTTGFSISCSGDSRRSSVTSTDEEEEKNEGFENDGEETYEVGVPKNLSSDIEKHGFVEALRADSQGSSVSCIEEGSVNEDDEKAGEGDAEGLYKNEGFENDGEETYEVGVPKNLSSDIEKHGFVEALRADSQESSVSCTDEGSVNEDDEKAGEGSLVSCTEEGSVNEDDEKAGEGDAEGYHVSEEVDDEEQKDVEVIEEECGWNLKGVLRISFVIVSLILSTLYISSMNSPPLSNNLEAIWGLNYQHQKFQYIVGLNASEGVHESIDHWRKKEIRLMKFDIRETSDGFEEKYVTRDEKEELVEIIDELGEVEAEVQVVQIEPGIKEGPDQIPLAESADSQDDKEELVEIVDESGEVEAEVQDVQIESVCDNQPGSKEGPDQFPLLETAESQDELSDSLSVGFDEVQVAKVSENNVNSGLANEDEKVARVDGVEPVAEVSNQMLKDEAERAEDIDNNESNDLNAGNVESGPQNPDSYSIKYPLGNAKFGSIPAVGVPIIFAILACVCVIYYLRQKVIPVEESPSGDEPLIESVLAEKITAIVPSNVEEEEEDESDGAQTFASTSSLFRAGPEGSAEEISRSQSHAPSVELLGEFVIGKVSSSLRSCGTKSWNIEKEEQSYNSVSRTEVSGQAKTSYMELSTGDSILVGSSSTEKHIVEKKRGKDAESTPVRRSSRVLSSPVRRSSRLRERSAMSP